MESEEECHLLNIWLESEELAKSCITKSSETIGSSKVPVARVKEVLDETVWMYEFLLELENCLENIRLDLMILFPALSYSLQDEQSRTKMLAGLNRFFECPGHFQEYLKKLQKAIEVHQKLLVENTDAGRNSKLKSSGPKHGVFSAIFATGLVTVGGMAIVAWKTEGLRGILIPGMPIVAVSLFVVGWLYKSKCDATPAKEKVNNDSAELQKSIIDSSHIVISSDVEEVTKLKSSVNSLIAAIRRRTEEDPSKELGTGGAGLQTMVDKTRQEATELETKTSNYQNEIKEYKEQIMGIRRQLSDHISNPSPGNFLL